MGVSDKIKRISYIKSANKDGKFAGFIIVRRDIDINKKQLTNERLCQIKEELREELGHKIKDAKANGYESVGKIIHSCQTSIQW